jgi:glycosyltransferase involved in cell wall biosynthesis
MLVDGFSQMEFLEENSILKTGQATVLGNGSICGININRFSPDAKIREELRLELGLTDNDIVFIFLGRLKREKGIYELLSAFNEIAKDSENAVLVLVGSDEEECLSSLDTYTNIRLGKNLIYYGYTSRPEDMYRAADVYVLPTYREGFGLSILEASCSGLPIITTDTYGVRDSIIDNQTGLRCKTYDVDTLAQCMKQLYDDSDERKRLGENGIRYVHENFTTDLVCGAWLDYYKQVVK